MPRAYYNEIDPYAAQWLRNLIKAGHIAKGDVDERSIEDVAPSDLKGYTQCHFFAGIGVWSYALRLNKWPDEKQVWTGSCPCQPFSQAGAQQGFDDERHLWPAFHWLIQECKPAIVFGEQVASKDANTWLDLVSSDMEGLDFAFAACAFPSAGIGAPHIRDRTYFVAHANNTRLERRSRVQKRTIEFAARPRGVVGKLANSNQQHGNYGRHSTGNEFRALQDTAKVQRRKTAVHATGPVNGFWKDADWLSCRDGKWRPVEPGTFPLVDGTSSRVGRLRAYGNAVNAYAAAAFIKAAITALEET